jgi:hypothetical protein
MSALRNVAELLHDGQFYGAAINSDSFISRQPKLRVMKFF